MKRIPKWLRSQAYDFSVMRFDSGNHSDPKQYLYLIDPDVDRFPYGSDELTGKYLEQLRELNRQGFSMGYEPAYDRRPGVVSEWVMVAVGAVLGVIGLLGLVVSLLFGGGVLQTVSAAIGFLSGVSLAYFVRSWSTGPERRWNPGLTLFREIHEKRVDGCTQADKLAESLRSSWNRLLDSPEWSRLGKASQHLRKREMDRLLFGLAVATAADDPGDQEALLQKLYPDVVKLWKENVAAVDPARTPEQAVKELLATGPAPAEPTTIDVDYAPQTSYAPYPAEESK